MLGLTVVSMVTDRSAPIRERDGAQSLTYFMVEADLQRTAADVYEDKVQRVWLEVNMVQCPCMLFFFLILYFY